MPPKWAWADPGVVERLLELYRLDISSSLIAQKLGLEFPRSGQVTRNSVIGKLFRMGLTRDRPPARTLPRGGRAQHRDPPQNAPAARPRPPEALPLPINGLAPVCSSCQWPIGAVGSVNFRFCGAPVAIQAYCGAHWQAAHQGTTRVLSAHERERRRLHALTNINRNRRATEPV